eukprot:scaffold11434_cov127-Isochrysis_galbana.AAC.2
MKKPKNDRLLAPPTVSRLARRLADHGSFDWAHAPLLAPLGDFLHDEFEDGGRDLPPGLFLICANLIEDMLKRRTVDKDWPDVLEHVVELGLDAAEQREGGCDHVPGGDEGQLLLQLRHRVEQLVGGAPPPAGLSGMAQPADCAEYLLKLYP